MCHVVQLFIDKRAMLASQRTRLQGNRMRPHSFKGHLLPRHRHTGFCCQIPDDINEWSKAVLVHAESNVLNMIYEPEVLQSVSLHSVERKTKPEMLNRIELGI